MSGMYGHEGDGSSIPSSGGGYASGNYGGGGGYGGREYGGGGGGYGGNSQSRGGGGGGYQGGDRGRGGGGSGGRGGGGRDGDWLCPDLSCGNSNFARRTECNKCGSPNPAAGGDRGGRGAGDYRGSGGGRDYDGGRGGGGRDGSYGGNQGRDGGSRGGYQDRDSGSRGGSYGGSQGRDGGNRGSQGRDGGYGQTQPAAPTSYGGQGGNYSAPPNSYGGNYDTAAVPPPTSYTGGPNSYPPSYGAPVSYGGEGKGDARSGGRGDRSGGYGGQHYDDSSVEAPVKVKQCDETCDETCDNSRIYISNLPLDVTTEELKDLFGGIGQVGRLKQKRGYKDQWPWNIKIYTDDQGKNKGDAVLSYEDPSAAHSAGGFYNGYEMRGCKITVTMAEKTALKAAPPGHGGRGGGRGGYGGGDRRRDDRGSGPDRNYHGGNRARPY